MLAGIEITNADHTAEEIRALARKCKSRAEARRLEAIARVMEVAGGRGEIARRAKVDRQTLCDWINRYNAEGPAGLKSRPGRGRPSMLSEVQRAGAKPPGDRPDDPTIPDPALREPDEPASIQPVEEGPHVRVDNPVGLAPFNPARQRVERAVRTATGPEPVADPRNSGSNIGVRTVSATAVRTVLSSGAAMPSGRVPPSGLGIPPVGTGVPGNPLCGCGRAGQADAWPVHSRIPSTPPHPRRPVRACRRILLQLEAGCFEHVRRDAVRKRSELLLRFPRGCLPYPLRRLLHAIPTLCPMLVLASRIPPGSGPSLHRLRRNGCSPVRRLRRRHGRIRPLQSVRRRFGLSPFFSGPGTTAGAD